MRAAVLAGVLSGLPSTIHALFNRRDLLESTRAAGTLLAPGSASPGRLVAAGAVAHGALSLGWATVLARVLPPRHTVVAGAAAGFAIAALDLGLARRYWPRIATLPLVPQIADHVAFGALVGAVLSNPERELP